MSVRIYEIAKKLEMDNKALLELLQQRGFKVKSVSSTIDNISAEALIDEYKQPDVPAADVKTDDGQPESEAPLPPPAPKVNIPAGAIVKTAADLEKEKAEKEKVEQAKREAALEKTRREREAEAARLTRSPATPQPPRPTAPGAPKTPPPITPLRPPLRPIPPVSRAAQPAQAKAATKEAPAATPASKVPPAASSTKAPVIPPRNRPAPVPAPPKRVEPELPPRQNMAAEETAGEASVVEPADGATEQTAQVLELKPPIVVREFANLLDVKPFRLISELMDMGIFASMNQTIEEAVATKLASKHGFELRIKHRGDEEPAQAKAKEPDEDDPALLQPRPPVVCVLGHVDHGKTTLLDTLRNAHVVAGEAGGITQHIGAYQVEHKGQRITFIDTPGHAAFSKMRERGAKVTDVAVLVVAADDGFMPQTDEALKFAQKGNVPLVVAINKCDAKGANPDKVKRQMQERGIPPEELGGETQVAAVSALKGTGMDDLLEAIVLQAEVLELKANPKARPQGVIIESKMEAGRGPTASVIVQKGTLKVGDALVCGSQSCKIRAMMDEHGKKLKAAPPATPVILLGWSGVPDAGAVFEAAKNEREAKRMAAENLSEFKKSRAQAGVPAGAADLQALLDAIDQTQQKTLRLIVKGDVHGSVEALVGSLEAIDSESVKLKIVETSVGQITKNDITLASSSSAAVVGFNVRQESGVQALAKHHDVSIIQHDIIYELLDKVKELMAEQLDPEQREVKLGAAEVRQIFPLGKGFVAGCMVTEGILRRGARCRLLRGEEVISDSRISALKRFKDDSTEVRAGYECGVQLANQNSYVEGDVIECYEIQEFRPAL